MLRQNVQGRRQWETASVDGGEAAREGVEDVVVVMEGGRGTRDGHALVPWNDGIVAISNRLYGT